LKVKEQGMIGRPIFRACVWLVVASCIVALLMAGLTVADLFLFEYWPLSILLGLRGVLVLLVLLSGAILLIFSALRLLRGRTLHRPFMFAGPLALWAALVLYLLQWALMEKPLSVSMAMSLKASGEVRIASETRDDFLNFSLTRNMTDPIARRQLAVMYERILVNSPQVFAANPIGATIDRHAIRYNVAPELLFFFAYVNSFWGEAVSGPVPVLGMMTSETMRDVAQIHVPAWFVESRLRSNLIESCFFERLAGDALGFKLRYALHKATLDVSTQPYDVNLFSDFMQVVQRYPQEFPEITDAYTGEDAIVRALHESWEAIGATAISPAYEKPYASKPLEATYYEAHRDDLKKFGRAAYYRLVLDFDFSTRVIALVVKYQNDFYSARLGAQNWTALPDWQRAGMLAMTRDLYVPNVGRLGPNRYALGEINSTPVEFVAEQAIADPEGGPGAVSHAWLPRDSSALWAGASTKLRILSEVWRVARGSPIPGLVPVETLAAANDVIGLQKPGGSE
jgi:hypothetical protein